MVRTRNAATAEERKRQAKREAERKRKKAHYLANREALCKQKKDYYKANRETKLNYNKEYYKANRETVRNWKKAYYLANRKALCKKQKDYNTANREAIRKQKKEYYKTNREAVRKHKKDYYEANRETMLKQQEAYRIANRKALCKKQMDYYKANREAELKKQKEYAKANRDTARLRLYKYSAKKRGREYAMSDEDMMQLFASDCLYCGFTPPEDGKLNNGVDRMDNFQGYVPANCTPCCFPCNRQKAALDALTFLERCEHVSAHNDGPGRAHVECWSKPARAYTFALLKRGADRRSLVVELTPDEHRNMARQACTYCGRPPARGKPNGVDRVDSTQGYVAGNCVASCGDCNVAKGTTSAGDFLARCKAVAARAAVIRATVPPGITRCLGMRKLRQTGARGQAHQASGNRQARQARQASGTRPSSARQASGNRPSSAQASEEEPSEGEGSEEEPSKGEVSEEEPSEGELSGESSDDEAWDSDLEDVVRTRPAAKKRRAAAAPAAPLTPAAKKRRAAASPTK